MLGTMKPLGNNVHLYNDVVMHVGESGVGGGGGGRAVQVALWLDIEARRLPSLRCP